MLKTLLYTGTLALAAVVCVHAGETIMVSFQVGVEGWPYENTSLLIGLFLRWIPELQSVLYSGVSEHKPTAIRKIM